MPKVNIDYPSSLPADETFSKVKDMLNTDESLKKIDSSILCDFDDAGRCGTAKGSKSKAKIDVKESGDKSQVSIIVDLPMLLSPFKGQVKSTIEKKLAKILS